MSWLELVREQGMTAHERAEQRARTSRKHHQREAKGSGPPSSFQIKSLWLSLLPLFPPALHLYLIFCFIIFKTKTFCVACKTSVLLQRSSAPL